MTKVLAPKDKEKQLEETRKQFFEESKFDPYNQRLGLFSFPGTLAISDDTYSRGKPSLKNPDGSVKIAPRNFLTTKNKRGKTPDCYFSNYEYKEDKYDPKALKKLDKSKTERKKIHEAPWKPDGPLKEPYSLFESLPTENFKQIKRKLPDGSVYTSPKNFLTSPPKKGDPATTPGVMLGEYPEHKPDPYDRRAQLSREQAKRDKAKMQEQAFKTTVYGNRNFFDDKSTFGGQNPKPKVVRPSSFHGIRHEAPFVPPNPPRIGTTFEKFPEHIPDPFEVKVKKQKTEMVSWKTSYVERTKPCPSVSNMVQNLRSEYPSLRRR